MRRRRLRWQWKVIIAAISCAAIFYFIMRQKHIDLAFVPEFEVTRAKEYETGGSSEESGKENTLQDWQKVNKNVTCLLSFEDDCLRRIPVIATEQPEYALRHNLYGQYDTMGSVFTDAQDSPADNLVIYGHSSKTKNYAFTFLKKYADESYYDAHPAFFMTDDGGLFRCRVVSFASYDLNDENTFVGWAQDWMDDAEDVEEMFAGTIPYLLQRTDGIQYRNEQIVTLVTCDMERDNTRYVLQALKENL